MIFDMVRFSEGFPTFEGWLTAQKNPNSPYVQRIIKAHAKYPNATLRELRGHGSNPLRYPKRKPLYQRPWNKLTSKQKIQREMALKVVSESRRFPDRDPVQIAKSNGIKFSDVVRATGAFRKVGNKWIVNPSDEIPRIMHIYSNSNDLIIELNNSRETSLLGQYLDAVRWFIFKNEPERLEAFKNRGVFDSNLKFYPFETDPKKILEIVERREEPEFYSIYATD